MLIKMLGRCNLERKLWICYFFSVSWLKIQAIAPTLMGKVKTYAFQLTTTTTTIKKKTEQQNMQKIMLLQVWNRMELFHKPYSEWCWWPQGQLQLASGGVGTHMGHKPNTVEIQYNTAFPSQCFSRNHQESCKRIMMYQSCWEIQNWENSL